MDYDPDYSFNDSGDEEEASVTGKRQASIFLIDGSSSMFHPVNESSADEEDKMPCPFVLALKSAHSILTNKILLPTSEQDLVGVVIFGNESEVLTGRGTVRVLVDLQEPEAEAILKIESVWKEESKLANIEAAATNVSLPDAFHICGAIFAEHVTEYDGCQILLLTNNDDPHRDSPDLKRRTKENVTELQKADIDIHLFTLGKCFELNHFYEDLLNGEGQSNTLSSIENEEDLTARVCRQVHRQQPACKLDFTLGLDVSLKVELYNFIKPASIPKQYPLDRRTHQLVHAKVTKWAVSDCDAKPVAPHDVIKVVRVGGKDVAMTNEEMKQCKAAFGPRGLRLLGFKPIDQLDLDLSLRHASFIYPQDESVDAFRALLLRCQARRVAALCSLKSFATSKPHVVALVPQVEKEGHCGAEELPSGFHVFYIPYADQVRKFDYKALMAKANPLDPNSGFLAAEEKHVEVARQIINKLSMKNGFHPEIFQNPNLHTLWDKLEVKGLARDTQEKEFHDATKPDRERIDKKIGPLADSFNIMIFPGGAEPSQEETSLNIVLGVEDAARCGRLDKLPVKTLKQYLSVYHINTYNIRKNDLIKMVEVHLSKKS